MLQEPRPASSLTKQMKQEFWFHSTSIRLETEFLPVFVQILSLTLLTIASAKDSWFPVEALLSSMSTGTTPIHGSWSTSSPFPRLTPVSLSWTCSPTTDWTREPKFLCVHYFPNPVKAKINSLSNQQSIFCVFGAIQFRTLNRYF